MAVDVEIAVSAGASRALSHLDQVLVLWGARQDAARAALLGARRIGPGERGLAQLRFAAPTIAFAGQNAVLRRPSPGETIAGAVVIDPRPPERARSAARRPVLEAALTGDIGRIARALAARDGVVAVDEFARLGRLAPEDAARAAPEFEMIGDGRLAERAAIGALRAAFLEALTDAHGQAPTRFAIPAAQLRDRLARQAPRALIARVEGALAGAGDLERRGNGLALPGYDPFAVLGAVTRVKLEAMERLLQAGGMNPPSPAELAPDEDARSLLALLIDAGRAVALRNVALRQTLAFHRMALETAVETLRTAFPVPARFTTSQARESLATSRKFIVPVLEHFDDLGWTVRTGDLRTMAPR